MIWILIVIFVVSVFAGHWLWNSTYWSRQGIKGPTGIPILGNMFSYVMGRKHSALVYDDIYNSYPEAAYVGIYRILNEPAVLVRDPALIQEILINNFSSFRDNVAYVNEKIDKIMLYDPFVAKGKEWKAMRKGLSPVLSANKIKQSFPHMELICQRLRAFLSKNDKNAIDAKDMCSRFMIDVVVSVAFGLDAESFTNSKADCRRLMLTVFNPNPFSLLETIGFLFLPWLGKLIKFQFIPEELQHWLTTVVSSVMSERKVGEGYKNGGNDMVQWLIDSKQRAGQPVEQTFVLGHSATMLLEGFETSGSLMTFALYELAKNPDVQKKVRNEIDATLERFNGKLCYEATLQMTYLESALYETLRMHPVLMTLLKHCTMPFELPPQFKDTKSKKKFVATPGMVFVIPVTAIHSDSEIYPDPDKFDPERFNEENKDRRSSCDFLSLGQGPRICPGARFSITQVKAGLATVLSKYEVELSPETKPVAIDPTTFLQINKNKIFLKLKPRKEAKIIRRW